MDGGRQADFGAESPGGVAGEEVEFFSGKNVEIWMEGLWLCCSLSVGTWAAHFPSLGLNLFTYHVGQLA